MQKTKWQQLMDSTKGGLEYNPSQTFALHVMWVVRSPTAAKEMIEKGFIPCASATTRDSPTTLTYLFRIARDQSLATAFKNQVKTIGQHPHYQSALKSIEMGIPKSAIEKKLQHGGIDLAPLSWSPEELISNHQKELDFDPVVLECTEVYLDARSFYEHGCSRDWQKSSAEIWKSVRSLKPTTFCVGHPTETIWDQTLDSSLKAIRFTEENNLINNLKPGVFILPCMKQEEGDLVLFLELDLKVSKDKLQMIHSHLIAVQNELQASSMILLPTNLHESMSEQEVEMVHLRVMISVSFHVHSTKSASLKQLQDHCSAPIEGRVIMWQSEKNYVIEEFLKQNNLQLEMIDAKEAEQAKTLAGYGLHPLVSKLISDDTFHYKL